jgi:hypothetical protein
MHFFFLLFSSRRSLLSMLLLMISNWRINIILMLADNSQDDPPGCPCSISLTVAPAMDMRSLFLYDKFFVLPDLMLLPAFFMPLSASKARADVMSSSLLLPPPGACCCTSLSTVAATGIDRRGEQQIGGGREGTIIWLPSSSHSKSKSNAFETSFLPAHSSAPQPKFSLPLSHDKLSEFDERPIIPE